MDSTSKAQLVLPAVYKAIEDITKLSEIYEKYTTDLRVKKIIKFLFIKFLFFPIFFRKPDWKFNKLNCLIVA